MTEKNYTDLIKIINKAVGQIDWMPICEVAHLKEILKTERLMREIDSFVDNARSTYPCNGPDEEVAEDLFVGNNWTISYAGKSITIPNDFIVYDTIMNTLTHGIKEALRYE